MKKEFVLRIVTLMLCAAMVLALFACEGGEVETESVTDPAENDTAESDPDESDPDESDPDESDPDESGSEESGSNESEPDESGSEESGSNESESDDSGSDETDPEDERAEEAKADLDYYLAFDHKASENVRYFDGKSDGINPLSVNSKDGAKRVRLEAIDGGYYLYFVENAIKVYVNVNKTYAFASLVFESEGKTVYTFDEALDTLTVEIDGKEYFLGAYGDYTYFSLSELSYASDSYVSYLVAAQCDHAYVGDESGHAQLACAKCGAAAGALQPHGESVSVMEMGKKTTYCKDCGYILKIDYCDGFHWLSDKDGHWEGACNICGTPDKSAGKQPHSEVNSEFVTDATYSMGCSICAYAYYSKELTGITNIITPYRWGMTATTYYQLNGGKSYGQFFYEDGEVPYGRITGTNQIGQILFNRSYSDTANTSSNQQYLLEVGNAKYLLIKIRTNDNTQHMGLTFSTTGKDGGKTLVLPISMLNNDEWGVIAIDLAASFGDYYAKAAGNDEYAVDSFYFTMNDFESTTNLDVAYMAFFEGSFSDINTFVDEDEVILNSGEVVGWRSLIPGACVGEHAYGIAMVDGTCKYKCTICGAVGDVAEHSYSAQVVDGVCANKCTVCGAIGEGVAHTYSAQVVEGYYVGVCSMCGDKKSYGVKADGVNYFISPDEIKTSASGQGVYDKTLMSENGVHFLRIDNFTAPGGWGGVNVINKDVGVTGQYLVIKLRVGENGLSQQDMDIYVRSSGSGLVAEMLAEFKIVEDGEWHLVVIDLAERVADPDTYMQPSADGYHLNFLQLRPFSSKQTVTEPDDYTDIAFIALFDDIDDLKNIVSDETYEWSTSKTVSEIRKTADHTCAEHYPGNVSTSTVTGGTKYSATCSICSETCYEKFVPDSVSKYYTGKDFATTATTYFNAGKGTVLFDNDNGVVYGSESGNLQLIWHRAQADMQRAQRSNQTTTVDIGNARFFVIRLRTTNIARSLTFRYSTTGKNSTTAIATEADVNASHFQSDGTKGINVGDTYNVDSGFVGIKIPVASITEGEWTTFVIDLEAVASEYHVKLDGADSYVVDTFYFDEGDQSGSLDVEYMAFVEGEWSDVAELVGAGDVVNVTDKSGTYESKTLS